MIKAKYFHFYPHIFTFSVLSLSIVHAPSPIHCLLTEAAAYPDRPQTWDAITMDAMKYRKVKTIPVTKCWKKMDVCMYLQLLSWKKIIKEAQTSADFLLKPQNRFLNLKIKPYQNIHVYTNILYIHGTRELRHIDDGGQPFSYILDIEMHNSDPDFFLQKSGSGGRRQKGRDSDDLGDVNVYKHTNQSTILVIIQLFPSFSFLFFCFNKCCFIITYLKIFF